MFENLIELAKNKKISDLNLYNFKLNTKQFFDVVELFKFDTKIEYLNLGSNNLTDIEISALCDAIKQHDNSLKELDLSGNSIGKKGAYSIANMVKGNKKIENINLSWNKIKDMGAASILHSLNYAPNLKFVNIDWNGVKNKKKIRSLMLDILKTHQD